MSQRSSEYYLFLDLVSSSDFVIVEFTPQGKVRRRERLTASWRTEQVLPRLATVVGPGNDRPRGILVAQGSGSFTRTRLICTVVNALAYASQIPLAAVDSRLSVAKIVQSLPKLSWQKRLDPHYLGPAVGG